MDNITAAARVRPLVIQSLFMRVNGEPPTPLEIEAFCDRLAEITAAGGKLKLVQIYTVARRPAESYVAPLTDAEVDAIVAQVKQRTGLARRPTTAILNTSISVGRQAEYLTANPNPGSLPLKRHNKRPVLPLITRTHWILFHVPNCRPHSLRSK